MVQANYWDDESQKLYDIVYPDILQAVQDGILGAADWLGAEIGIDFDLLNTWAKEFAQNYTYELVHDITNTTMELLRSKVNSWIASGTTLDNMIKDLAASGIYSDYRAFMIATTEITRAFGEGNLEAWKQSGVVKQIQWMTGQDELVCGVCSALDGQIVGLGESGFQGYSSQPTEVNMVRCPPAHVNCRCYLRPIWG